MILTISRRQYNKSNQYNERCYKTEDDDLILEYLDAYADNNINTIEWIESNLSHFQFNGNSMSIGFIGKDDNKVEYKVVLNNEGKIFVDILRK